MKVSLYRYFGGDDRLLYVGISNNPITRLRQHGKSKDLTSIRWIELEWFGSRKEASLAEATAIHRERPEWNIAMQVASRQPRKTKLPLPPPDEPVVSKPLGHDTKFQGPPEPGYVWGFGKVRNRGFSGFLKPEQMPALEGALDIYLRYGDVLVVGAEAHMPRQLLDHCRHGVYVIEDGEAPSVDAALALSASRTRRWARDRAIEKVGHGARNPNKGES